MIKVRGAGKGFGTGSPHYGLGLAWLYGAGASTLAADRGILSILVLMESADVPLPYPP
jgi:hypothetical protein